VLYHTIVAYDPGKHTGWAVLHLDSTWLTGSQSVTSSLVSVETGMWTSGISAEQWKYLGREPFEGADCEVTDAMVELALRWTFAALVVEGFVPMRPSRDRDFLSPVRVTSGFAYAMHRVGRLVHYQAPAEKEIITPDRARRWGLWEEGYGTPDGAHKFDALRHGLVAAKKAQSASGAAIARDLAKTADRRRIDDSRSSNSSSSE
jgi:hypothetical protein